MVEIHFVFGGDGVYHLNIRWQWVVSFCGARNRTPMEMYAKQRRNSPHTSVYLRRIDFVSQQRRTFKDEIRTISVVILRVLKRGLPLLAIHKLKRQKDKWSPIKKWRKKREYKTLEYGYPMCIRYRDVMLRSAKLMLQLSLSQIQIEWIESRCAPACTKFSLFRANLAWCFSCRSLIINCRN